MIKFFLSLWLALTLTNAIAQEQSTEAHTAQATIGSSQSGPALSEATPAGTSSLNESGAGAPTAQPASETIAGSTLNMSGQSDVRVLIDISGSMKQNDPKNLRIPALNLITGLLPKGHKAGVWTFGQSVNMLVRHGEVDPDWRKLARSKAAQINSVGLFTNIGGALEKAFDDYREGKRFDQTHFILLTDGVVDISKSAEDNARERQRILDDVLPRFRQSGAHIHTIALSANADRVLLDKLAVSTGGLAAVAESSDDLNRIFLNAFDQAVPAEQAPIEGNQFNIDGSVQEFTALVFSKSKTNPLQLRAPDGSRISQKQHDDSVRWYQDQGYDLITVATPTPGQWHLEGDLQPGSRVTLVTNLRMAVNDLPVNFYPGDVLDLNVAFYEDDNIITSSDFLKLIDLEVTVTNDENLSGSKTLSTPGKAPPDGFYRDEISKLRKVGQYRVDVKADGKTFQRQRSQTIQLRSPIDVELQGTGSAAESRYHLIVTPRSDNIDGQLSSVMVKIATPDASNLIKSVPFIDAEHLWALDIEPSRGDGHYQVTVSVDGVLKTGQKFEMDLGNFTAEFPRPASADNQYQSIVNPRVADMATETIQDTVPESVAESPMVDLASAADESSKTTPTESTQEEQPDADTEVHSAVPLWVWVASVAGGLVVVGGVGALFWMIRRKRSATASPTANAGSKTDVRPVEIPAAPMPIESVSEDIDAELDVMEVPSDMSGNTDVDLTTQVESAADGGIVDGKSPEEIADAILAENKKVEEELDDEFNLEDFDISDTDGLPPAEGSDQNKPKK